MGTKLSAREAWIADLRNDIKNAEEQAASGPFYPERGITAESLRAYAEKCRQELAEPDASLRAALKGTMLSSMGVGPDGIHGPPPLDPDRCSGCGYPLWDCACDALHASPSPSASGDTRAESGAEVPASVKGAVRAWDRSFCREAVCYCHDEASTPRFCGHCGCRPETAQVSP